MFGSNLGVDDFAVIVRANHLCDQLGIDTISGGAVIASAIEGHEKGIIPAADFEGLTPAWGDPDFILPMIGKIARREGIGDTLAGGASAIIQRWPEMHNIISHVKGLEQSAYDARVAITMALGFGTSDIGAHHARAWPIAKELEMGMDWGLEEKADLVIYHQTVRPLFDMLGVCRLPWIELGFDERQYAGFYSATTGIETSFDELLEKSRSIYDLTRRINVGLGVQRQDDLPPQRVFEVPIATGPFAGAKLQPDEYERLLSIYYEKRGWSPEGVPPDQRAAPTAASGESPEREGNTAGDDERATSLTTE
jgi:aldehyde:ferredoxin oxidoreductase